MFIPSIVNKCYQVMAHFISYDDWYGFFRFGPSKFTRPENTGVEEKQILVAMTFHSQVRRISDSHRRFPRTRNRIHDEMVYAWGAVIFRTVTFEGQH